MLKLTIRTSEQGQCHTVKNFTPFSIVPIADFKGNFLVDYLTIYLPGAFTRLYSTIELLEETVKYVQS